MKSTYASYTFFLIAVLLLVPAMLRCQSVDEKYKSLLEALDEAREKNDYPMLAEAYYDLAMYEEAHNSNLELSFQQL